ncbi:MAG TPA: hypothetical protein VL334_24600 [Anaerolineae bacterium]|nr:hypothetical protein [Anaerolineae bacterium]
MVRKLLWLIGSLLLLAACGSAVTPSPTAAPAPVATRPQPPATEEPGALAAPASREDWLARVPALAEREARFQAAVTSDQPILLFASGDEEQQRAQEIAVASPDVQYFARDVQTSQPLRSEIMIVRPTLPSDLTEATQFCANQPCYRVEMYNYATNSTAVAIVEMVRESVLDVTFHPNAQPEVPAYLGDLAAQIAVNAPEVAEALGFEPARDQASMPGVKTALNDTLCERSRHLCVAPTFIVGDRALWAIVDLTDGRLVGTRWTNLGGGGGAVVTEKTLQDAVIMAQYCDKPNPLARNGWELDFMLTSSDGLQIGDVRYQGQPVLESAKLVDWHVSYSGTDGFGYSDATGCPMFSTASVVAFDAPYQEDIVENGEVVGFALSQDFRNELWPQPCNYRYVQRYEFYDDGRFRVGGSVLGQGCGNNGTYTPVVRIALATRAEGGQPAEFADWDGDQWRTWTEEQWVLQDENTPVTAEGFQFRILASNGRTYYVEPNRGQLPDGSRGDNAYTYVTVARPGEGDADLLTIGPCCNEDHRQGPEQFMEPPEPLAGEDLVMWYVPRLKNDDTPGAEYCWVTTEVVEGELINNIHPCAFGALFVPAP